jgi:hypothetical protein
LSDLDLQAFITVDYADVPIQMTLEPELTIRRRGLR